MCIRDSTDDGSRWHCRNVSFVENIGLRPNIPGRNFNKNYFFVADNVVHIYIKNMHKINGLYKFMIDLH